MHSEDNGVVAAWENQVAISMEGKYKSLPLVGLDSRASSLPLWRVMTSVVEQH